MHNTETNVSLNSDVKKVADVEAAIELKLQAAKKKSDEILAQARANRIEILETSEQEAASARQTEVELVRKEVSAECREIVKNAQKQAAETHSTIPKAGVKKLLDEFKNLASKEAKR